MLWKMAQCFWSLLPHEIPPWKCLRQMCKHAPKPQRSRQPPGAEQGVDVSLPQEAGCSEPGSGVLRDGEQGRRSVADLTHLPHWVAHHTCCPRRTKLLCAGATGSGPRPHPCTPSPAALPIMSVPQDAGRQLCCHCLVMW